MLLFCNLRNLRNRKAETIPFKNETKQASLLKNDSICLIGEFFNLRPYHKQDDILKQWNDIVRLSERNWWMNAVEMDEQLGNTGVKRGAEIS